MLDRRQGFVVLALVAAIGLSGRLASADPAEVFVSGKIEFATLSPFLKAEEVLSAANRRDQVDYGLFATELIAFVVKEVFPNSRDEYAGSSRIPFHMSADVPGSRSDFGRHCLIVLKQFRTGRVASREPIVLPEIESPSHPGAALGWLRGAALFAGEVWSALRNEVEDRQTGISLRPKLSSRKVALKLTVRW
jgi:hypothetical protein